MTTLRKNKLYSKIIIQCYFTALITFLTLSTIPVQAAQNKLPRNLLPPPRLINNNPINPKPKIKIGTRPTFNPTGFGALPDLVIMRGVRTTINPRIANMCRTGKKDHPGGSIPVLKFSFKIKNVGKGTAYMNRDGVIVSSQPTDFSERVFNRNAYYLGGKGGPKSFVGHHGNRQNWILKKLGYIAPGKIINATSHQGIGANNKTFTLNRLHELAGKTHKFLLRLDSYGNPGLKESNKRNNRMLVSYTFPRNFCQLPANTVRPVTARPVTAPVPVFLPDLKIVSVTPKLNIQAKNACKTGKSPHGGLVSFNLKVKNIGKGVADLRKYTFAVRSTSIDGKNPAMRGGEGYSGARRTPAKVKPGQTFNVTGASGVTGGYYGRPVTFPVRRYSELAGKTRRFKVELVSGTKIGRGLKESNFNNNLAKVSYTFPANFCKAKQTGVIAQQVGTINHDLEIQKVSASLKRPFECRTDGPAMAYINVRLKNKGIKFDPAKTRSHSLRINARTHGLKVGTNRIILNGSSLLKTSIAAGATKTVRFPLTGTAGIFNRMTPPLKSFAGKTMNLSIYLDGKEKNYSAKTARLYFPKNYCK